MGKRKFQVPGYLLMDSSVTPPSRIFEIRFEDALLEEEELISSSCKFDFSLSLSLKEKTL